MSRAARVSHLMRARSYSWPDDSAKHKYAVIVNGVVAFQMLARNITEVANASRGALNVRVFKCKT
jgi:hypothetical protein